MLHVAVTLVMGFSLVVVAVVTAVAAVFLPDTRVDVAAVRARTARRRAWVDLNEAARAATGWG
jgi:hypothetical protein